VIVQSSFRRHFKEGSPLAWQTRSKRAKVRNG
jgi:hypothetical protein